MRLVSIRMSGILNRRSRHPATALLCVALTLNVSTWTGGCSLPFAGPTIDGNVFRLALTPGQPLAELLRGSAFDGGEALEVNLATGAFRIVYADSNKNFSGQLAARGGAWKMDRFEFAHSGQGAALHFDPESGEIIRIETSDGQSWERGKRSDGKTLRDSDSLHSYLSANADLIAIASQGGDKTDEASLGVLPGIIGYLIYVFWICAGTVILCPGLPQLLAIIIALLGSIPPPQVIPDPDPPPPQNQPPIARDDAFTTPMNTAVSGNVLSNNGSGADSDPDGDSLSTTIDSGPPNGNASLGAGGAFTYTPNNDFVGTDTFTYTLSDGTDTDTATVTITVTAVNNPPIAQDDDFEVFAEDTLNGNLFIDNGNDVDSDPDGDTITIIEVNGSAANVGVVIPLTMDGTVIVNADGTFEYSDGGFAEVEQSFTYTISDGNGGTDTATVTIVVRGN